MPFLRPTLTELIARITSELDSRIPGADARLRRSNLGVLARVHAGAVHSLYGYLDFISRQIMPDTAEAEYLERWAVVWGLHRKPAAQARGFAVVTINVAVNIPSGTLFQLGDGTQFSCSNSTYYSSVSPYPAMVIVEVQAVLPGITGNCAEGANLTMVTPLAGVSSEAIAAGISGGADSETDAALLVRLLARIRQPPHGGAAFDYVAWALDTAGVTRG